MTKKLTVIGNSLGIILDKPILELLQLDKDTEFDLTLEGERLVLTPMRAGRRRRLQSTIGRAMKNHDRTLRKLSQ